METPSYKQSKSNEPLTLGESLESGVVLPVQFYARAKCREFEGERRLLLAVLENALQSYLATRAAEGGSRRREFLEVRGWFESRSNCALFDFESICDQLEINAASLRRKLFRTTVNRQSIPRLLTVPAREVELHSRRRRKKRVESDERWAA